MARILIIRFSALGDVAMTIPVIHSLAVQYPQHEITVLSRAVWQPLFQGLPTNVGFVGADLTGKHKGLWGLNSLYSELKDKMKLEDAFELKLAHEQEKAVAGLGEISDGRQEAVEALVALGYSSTDALRAVRKVTDVAPDDVEGLLKAALKNF